MKLSLTLGLALAMFANTAMAETPTETAPKPEQAAKMPHMDGNMMGEKIHKRMDERMSRAWQELDANNDGAITKEESSAYSNKKFEEKDTNKDGKVTKAEWDAFRAAKMTERKAKMGMSGNMPMGDRKPMSGEKPAAPAEPKK